MKTRAVERFRAQDYIQRAQQCKVVMDRAYEDEQWNACVIMAVHCAISAVDAYCVFKKGLRNAGQNHYDSIHLFLSIDPTNNELKTAVQHLASLIDIKTGAEYGEKLSMQKEAEYARKHAERLFAFVQNRIT